MNVQEKETKINELLINSNLINFNFYNWLNINPIIILKKDFNKINLLIDKIIFYSLDYINNNSLDKILENLNISAFERDLIKADFDYTKMFNFIRVDFGFEANNFYLFELNSECPGGYGDLFLLEKIVSIFSNERIETSINLGDNFKNLFINNFNLKKTLYVVFSDSSLDEDKINEFNLFKNKFLNSVFNKIEIIDLDNIEFTSKGLFFKENKIEQIFRMFDLDDIIKHINITTFVNYYKNKELIIMNPFSDSLIGNKGFLALILNEYEDRFRFYFNNINQIFLDLKFIDKTNVNQFYDNHYNYVIKKGFSTRGESVFFGDDFNKISWIKKINSIIDNQLWVIQKKINLEKTTFKSINKNMVVEENNLYYDYLPFYINRQFSGAFSRLSLYKKTNLFWKKGGISAIKIL